YPSRAQIKRLYEILKLHRHLYNRALEERIHAYRSRQISISYKQQAKELTELRADLPEYENLNAQSEQLTLKRLDLAFKSFFRRLKESSQKAGFPRFKSSDRFKNFGYPSYGDGWKFEAGNKFINGKLKLSGIGQIKARGRGRSLDKESSTRNPGTPKTLQVIKENDHWFASITYETAKPYRASGEEVLAFDWGVSTFLTAVTETAKIHRIENPRTLKKSSAKLKKHQKQLSAKKKGSKNRLKAKRKVRKIHQKVAHQREDFLHQISSKLVKQSLALGSEELSVKSMTAQGGAYKSGLNKAILDTAPGKFLSLLEYKAEEAGIPFILVNTRELKPTQICSNCFHQEKKTLSERIHQCKHCGLTLDRDVNAALVLLHYLLMALKTGREPTLGVEKGMPFSEARNCQP
ncbi:MAG: transposase, partial [Planctomycetota bacterium]